MTFIERLSLKRSSHAQPGMTLVELMLVLTIGAILIGGTLGIARMLFTRAKQSKTQTVLQAVRSGIESFHTDTDEYPRTLEDLRRQPEGELGKRWQGPYYDKKPIDGWDRPLVYRVTPEADHAYELYSYGSGGKKGKTKLDVWNL